MGRVAQVLGFCQEGKTNAEIAVALGLAPTSLRQFMRQQGYVWDGLLKTWIPRSQVQVVKRGRPAKRSEAPA